MISRDFAQPSMRRAWRKELLDGFDESKWDRMARELFAWQYERVTAYRRLCQAHGITPKTLGAWTEIPAVPQQLFKREKLFAHVPRSPGAIYETSGTTTGQPGRQHLLQSDLYRAVAVEGARQTGLFTKSPFLHFLTASPHEMPHSSLSAMFGFWGEKPTSHFRFHVVDGAIDFRALRALLVEQIKARRSVALAGTAFSFIHLLDAWADLPPLRLPAESWVLETGGFKGRSREVSKPELYAQLASTLGVPDRAIWNEYGMSELSSQAYAQGTHGGHVLPPWARVLVWNPLTGHEVRRGQRGLIRWFDLANVDSVMALQTLDLAERRPNEFRLIGRLSRTEPRGCSLSAEDLASAASS